MSQGAGDHGGLRVLGFPVHVRSGFIVFMVLIAGIHANAYGLWLAGSLAVFTLIHELGHAVAARRAGAQAEISLEFMAGYASYVPTRPISLPRRAGIALSGPLTHIAAGTLALLALGEHPIAVPDADATAAQAIWWAGPVIGAFNLVPVLPLDGGNVVTTLLERVLPAARARRAMLYASIAITVGVAVATALSERTRGLTVFIALLVAFQLQSLFDERAEEAGSPIDRARAALDAGKPAKARRILAASMRRPTRPVAPAPITPTQAEELVALLPDPLPTGPPAQEYVLANLLLSARRYEEAAYYAAASYERSRRPMLATVVARAAAALGNEPTAIAWLRTASDGSPGASVVARVLEAAPELAELRDHPDLAALR